jgi:hypothetical protein
MTAGEWIGILVGAALVAFLMLLGLLVLLDYLGLFGRGRWD